MHLQMEFVDHYHFGSTFQLLIDRSKERHFVPMRVFVEQHRHHGEQQERHISSVTYSQIRAEIASIM